MTLRNSFAGLPAFLFGDGGLHNQLVCDVRTFVRAVDGDGRTLLAPMVAWSPGPPAIGDTGDNSPGHMMGTTWLLQVCPDGSWVLYREDRGRLEVVPFDDPPDPVTATARHVSLCFDQSARVVLAWEDQGIIKVRRWDPSQNEYIENVSFAGVDPVVVFDAQWAYQIPGSDVLLFYLSSDRERVMARVQRDVYAVEYEIWNTGGFVPGPPDPRTDDQTATATTGSAYPAWSSAITINDDGLLTHVRADAYVGGTHSLTINGGAAITASGGPGVVEFELPTPLLVAASDVLTVRVASPSSARVRYASGSRSGSLWSASSVTFEGFGPFAGAPALGLTIDVAEPIPVPGQPVILDRVIALPYKYQVLVSDASGQPLPDMLISALYPLQSRVGVVGDGVIADGTYTKMAEGYMHAFTVVGDGAIVGGEYATPLTDYAHVLPLVGDGIITSGQYRSVVTRVDQDIRVVGDGVIASGEYKLIGIPIAHDVNVVGDGEIIGGTYETP